MYQEIVSKRSATPVKISLNKGLEHRLRIVRRARGALGGRLDLTGPGAIVSAQLRTDYVARS